MSTSKWPERIIEISVGAGVLCLSMWLDPLRAEHALLHVLLGVTTIILLAIIFDPHHKMTRDLDDKYGNLLHAISDLPLHNALVALRHATLEVPEAKMVPTWIDLLWRIDREFCATSYVSPDHWEQSYPFEAADIQALKARLHTATIRRIYIVASEDEVAHIEMKLTSRVSTLSTGALDRAGVHNRYLLKTAADRLLTLQRAEHPLHIDFGIFDRDTVFLWSLKERKVAGGRLLFGRAWARVYQQFFDQLWQASEASEDIRARREANRRRGHAILPQRIYNIAHRLVQLYPELREYLSDLTDKYQSMCKRLQVNPSKASAVVSWGGGKDSTIALALMSAVVERSGGSLNASTMDNPGMSDQTLSNITRVTASLGVSHEFWHFARKVPSPHLHKADWFDLYRRLYQAVGGGPRFMCVACNFGSIVTEYMSLSQFQAPIHVTGNPPWELEEFSGWVTALRDGFRDTIDFPESLRNDTLDYYRFWWAIYDHLIGELYSTNNDPARHQELRSRFLYPLPDIASPIASMATLRVLPNEHHGRGPAEAFGDVLSLVGWEFPDDIMGSTESDCKYPAAIAHININRKSLMPHLRDLEDAVRHFRPLPVMRARAYEWSQSQRVHQEGATQLAEMGVDSSTPVANATRDKSGYSMKAIASRAGFAAISAELDRRSAIRSL